MVCVIGRKRVANREWRPFSLALFVDERAQNLTTLPPRHEPFSTGRCSAGCHLRRDRDGNGRSVAAESNGAHTEFLRTSARLPDMSQN